ncbi:MAG: hypothetical protein ABI824_19605 [Acidobacteriota bacterium]
MWFNPTPTNMTALLVVALAIVSLYMVLRKRYDSNVPFLFYAVALMFADWAERPVEPAIMLGGFGMILLLRFEFMGAGFTKLIAFFANLGLCTIIWIMLSEVGS